MNLQHELTIGWVGGGAIDDFEKVDAIPVGIAAHRRCAATASQQA